LVVIIPEEKNLYKRRTKPNKSKGDNMWIVTPPKAISEGTRLVEELRKRDITNHIKLVSQQDMMQKVRTFLTDSGKAVNQLQNEIASEVSLPSGAYNAGRVKNLRMQMTQLRNIQDKLLELVGNA